MRTIFILYVPFKEETELVDIHANLWKNAVAPAKDVYIFRHGDMPNIDFGGDVNLVVYILGHGVDPTCGYGSKHIASHSVMMPATTVLSVEEVAARFESDFMYYRPFISTVKLYFCNTYNTHKQIAEDFQKNSLLCSSANVKVDYYYGVLCTPVPNKYALLGYQTLARASRVRASLFSPSSQNHLSAIGERMDLKTSSYLAGCEKAHDKRMNQVENQRDEKKEDIIWRRRGVGI